MDGLQEIFTDRKRGLLFNLLANCIFSSGERNDCFMCELRKDLTTEQKYQYIMNLSDEKVKAALMRHEECLKKYYQI
jgi:hypothetical protein